MAKDEDSPTQRAAERVELCADIVRVEKKGG